MSLCVRLATRPHRTPVDWIVHADDGKRNAQREKGLPWIDRRVEILSERSLPIHRPPWALLRSPPCAACPSSRKAPGPAPPPRLWPIEKRRNHLVIRVHDCPDELHALRLGRGLLGAGRLAYTCLWFFLLGVLFPLLGFYRSSLGHSFNPLPVRQSLRHRIIRFSGSPDRTPSAPTRKQDFTRSAAAVQDKCRGPSPPRCGSGSASSPRATGPSQEDVWL
jgi:hypothetical protein